MPELPIPEAVDEKSGVELLRVWADYGKLAVSSNPNAYPDPAHYGVALADLITHLAFICAAKDEKPQEKSKAEIIEVFYREVNP
ncbi:MAG: DUF5076 domain-containing protein [Leptolyngbya sp.]|nr:DUF5076 domain-containing protein [Candidatus Melainabacteria bacterium]